MKFKKIELPYPYNSLEPYIDELTVKTHYEKHHNSYEENFNLGIKDSDVEKYNTLDEIMLNFKKIPEDKKNIVRNAGGGLINHNIYWNQFILDKNKLTANDQKNKQLIIEQFGSQRNCYDEIIKVGLTIFGSGWVWLVKKNNELKIITTPNQENPLMYDDLEIVLGIDVWEHAYYLKYKQDRKSYLSNVLMLTILNK